MVDRHDSLEEFLADALDGAREQGLLEGMTKADIAIAVVRASVRNTGALDNTSEAEEERKANMVASDYEIWRGTKMVPDIFGKPGQYSVLTIELDTNNPNAGYFMVPNLDSRVIIQGNDDSKFKLLFEHYEMPDDVTDLRKLRMIRPAIVRNPGGNRIVEKGIMVFA